MLAWIPTCSFDNVRGIRACLTLFLSSAASSCFNSFRSFLTVPVLGNAFSASMFFKSRFRSLVVDPKLCHQERKRRCYRSSIANRRIGLLFLEIPRCVLMVQCVPALILPLFTIAVHFVSRLALLEPCDLRGTISSLQAWSLLTLALTFVLYSVANGVASRTCNSTMSGLFWSLDL